jgi:hypothetical protein
MPDHVDGPRVERVQDRCVNVEAAIDLVARIQINVGEPSDPAQRRGARNAPGECLIVLPYRLAVFQDDAGQHRRN